MPVGINKLSRNSQIGIEIPDSVVSRDPDDNQNSSDSNVGLKFSTSQEWTDIQCKLSSNTLTASDETIVVDRVSDGVEIASKDISSLSSGDIVTFNDINLSANTSYYIYNKSSNSRQWGYDSNPSYPYTSSDGNLSIESGYNNVENASNAYALVTIGNINQ